MPGSAMRRRCYPNCDHTRRRHAWNARSSNTICSESSRSMGRNRASFATRQDCMSITLRYHVIDGCHRSGSRLSERPLLPHLRVSRAGTPGPTRPGAARLPPVLPGSLHPPRPNLRRDGGTGTARAGHVASDQSSRSSPPLAHPARRRVAWERRPDAHSVWWPRFLTDPPHRQAHHGLAPAVGSAAASVGACTADRDFQSSSKPSSTYGPTSRG